MHVAVLETGGTINGILDPDAPPPTRSRVVDWLREQRERLQLDIDARIVVMKDSRAIDDADRAWLAAAIEASDAQRILVPHGTYTMPDTGIYLRRHLSAAARARTVVLVGSMIPLDEPDSDAPAALEFALEALRSQPAGVWIAMGKRVWHPAGVLKDPASGEYVARSTP